MQLLRTHEGGRSGPIVEVPDKSSWNRMSASNQQVVVVGRQVGRTSRKYIHMYMPHTNKVSIPFYRSSLHQLSCDVLMIK